MRNSIKSKVIHRQDDDSLRRRIAKLEAENRLLSNEMAEIRDLLDGSVQGIMIHRDYKPLYANAAFAAILGYSGPAEIMQIGTTLSLFAEEEREKAQTIAEARRQGGDAPDHYEYQGLRKDGSLVWLSNTVRVVNWDGAPAIQSTITDISLRKQAEEAQRASEERFRNLVEGSLQGILVMKEDRTVFANGAAATIFGYGSPAEMIDTPMSERVAPREMERINGYYDARLRGEEPPGEYEYEGVKQDGSPVWIHVMVNTTLWEGELASQTTLFDVTERKRAMETLRESEQRFKDFSEVASDWLWETDQNFLFNYISDRFEEATGLAAKTVLGKTRWGKWRVGSEADGEMWDDHIADMQAHKPFTDLVYSFRDKQGGIRFARVSGKPLYADDGSFRGYRGTGSDITAEMSAITAAELAHSRLIDAIESMPAAFSSSTRTRNYSWSTAIRGKSFPKPPISWFRV